MHRVTLLFSIFVVGLIFSIGLQPQRAFSEPGKTTHGTDEPAFAPGRILVKLKGNATAHTLELLNRKNEARLEEKLPHSRVIIIELPEDLSVAKAVERYETSPNVEYAEPDYAVYPEGAMKPNDHYYSSLYNLENNGQNGGSLDADIDAQEAWGITTGRASTVVAVIDTGVDIRHPELKDNIWTNPDEIPGNARDDDHNGYVDDVHGWDFHNDDESVFDSATADSHGTHVAGTIGAVGNNDIGIVGVSWRVKIMPLKFIGPDVGYVSDAAQALNYAVAEGVKISNNSYTYYDTCDGCYSRTLLEAINKSRQEGHLFVAAAGNGYTDKVGDDIDTTSPKPYPASYESANVISVAASDRNDNLTSFSNYGETSVDLAAPGLDIISTLPGKSYGTYWGTSMATPHVAGVAALLKSRYVNASAARIKLRILESVDKKSSFVETVSGGRLNAAKALRG